MPMSSENPTARDPHDAEPQVFQGIKEPRVGRASRMWDCVLIVATASLAGTGAWWAGEYTRHYFKPSKAVENYRDPTTLNQEMPVVNTRNAAMTFGALGGLLGFGLGLVGGLVGRSPDRALAGAAIGLGLGAAAGALPSFVLMPWQWAHRNDDPWNSMLLTPMLLHIGLWAGAGMAAGVAFGIGYSGFKAYNLLEAAVTGLAGAMLGSCVFDLVGAFFFPLAHTALPVSETAGTRFLARICVAGFVGLGAVRSIPWNPKTNSLTE
jgi:hypothetical protein